MPRRRCRRGAIGHLSSSARVLAEERGLGRGRLLELVEQHALVGRVDVRVAVGRADQQDLGLGRRGLQRADERDRAAAAGASPAALPQAARQRGARRRRRPGPSSAPRTRCRSPRRRTSSAMPNGRTASRWRTSAACASAASCSGCTRRLSFARACGETALSAPSTDGTSIPVTVIAGPDQTREPRPPVPMQRQPGAAPRPARGTRRRCRTRRSTPRGAGPRRRRRRARRAASRAPAAARAARPARRRRTGRCAWRRRAWSPRS